MGHQGCNFRPLILVERKRFQNSFTFALFGEKRMTGTMLFRSRWTLSYSYHFAFYMFGHKVFNDEMTKEDLEIKQHLFEEQQQHLTTNVEKLSKFIEEPFDSFTQDKIMEIRMQVINLYVITDTYFVVRLFISDGGFFLIVSATFGCVKRSLWDVMFGFVFFRHLEDRQVAVDKPAVELEYRNCYATGCEYHRDERWNYSKLCAQDTIDYTKLRSCLIEVVIL
ncbi:RING/U-box superfamily protein [Artemisia annua]|uniref:RING/U-box superfamily protein n=1 Tax=Artemisia annua TaxID=35608 RepID=A0A2U1LA94_ARTAN|nr:RING/U-box superfamily protein [Artemisia annua]